MSTLSDVVSYMISVGGDVISSTMNLELLIYSMIFCNVYTFECCFIRYDYSEGEMSLAPLQTLSLLYRRYA